MYISYNGEKKILHRKEPTSVRIVTAMQAEHNCRKGCVMFAVHISSDKGKYFEDVEIFKRYPILQQFEDIFSIEIPQFPSLKEVDFSIELVLGATPTSKAPYMMSTLELVELKLQIKEIIDKA